MQKIELNNTTFIVFLRIDNEERLSNIIAMTSFYRNNIVNPKFIFIEDTPNKMHCDVIKPQDGDQYFGYTILGLLTLLLIFYVLMMLIAL